jgi:hypothetical protein
LLSTPPRGDAVTVGYRPEKVYLERTCTSLIKYAHRRTRTGLRAGHFGGPILPRSDRQRRRSYRELSR